MPSCVRTESRPVHNPRRIPVRQLRRKTVMPSPLVGHLERWDGARVVVKGAVALIGGRRAVEGAMAAEKAAMRFFKVVVGGQEGRRSRGDRPTALQLNFP